MAQAASASEGWRESTELMKLELLMEKAFFRDILAQAAASAA